MTVQRPNAQVKYELLEDYYSRPALKKSYMWSACGLVLLITCVSIISLYVAMQRLLTAKEHVGAMDFIMTGPEKVIPGHVEVSRVRAEMYASSVFKNLNSSIDGFLIHPALTDGGGEATETENAIVDSAEPMKLVCYYSIPVNNSAEDQLWPDLVDPLLCTHMLIAFAFINNGTIEPNSVTDYDFYHQVVEMKKQNPELKVMISVQCFSNNGEFALVVETKFSRQTFIESAVRYMDEHHFDGLDIDWEFPVWPGSDKKQLVDFTTLLKELRSAFDANGNKRLITVAVAAPGNIINTAYEIQQMAEYVDFINLMSYDYHYYTTYLPLTGPNAPLYQRHSESGIFTTLNTNWSSSYWLNKGMPRRKIVIGLPTYGHSFTLLNEKNTGWNAPAISIGRMGDDSFVQYPDICRFLKRKTTKMVFDPEHKVPYAYNGKEWVSYDNEQSLGYKSDYIKNKGFGGAMIFALNDDDYKATCGRNDFPLVRAVKSVLDDDQL